MLIMHADACIRMSDSPQSPCFDCSLPCRSAHSSPTPRRHRQFLVHTVFQNERVNQVLLGKFGFLQLTGFIIKYIN
jgi:hypothetical protein